MIDDELDSIIKLIQLATHKQLGIIIEQVKTQREILNKRKITQFHVDDEVEFESNGKIVKGTITKVKIKRVSVKTDQGRWDVPATMLEFSQ